MKDKFDILAVDGFNEDEMYTDPKVFTECSREEIEMANRRMVENMLKGKKVVAMLYNDNVSGFRMISFLIKGKKATYSLRRGYALAYVVNLDEPVFSEYGDIVLEHISKDKDCKVFERIN
jgi:hypothetical protein